VDGLQVPVIPFVDVVGNAGTVPPLQITRLVPMLNNGRTFGLTITLNVVVGAQIPPAGVNV